MINGNRIPELPLIILSSISSLIAKGMNTSVKNKTFFYVFAKISKTYFRFVNMGCGVEIQG